MRAGRSVIMSHPAGYANAHGSGGRVVGWIPKGIRGAVHPIAPARDRAVVHFEGKLMATVPLEHLQAVVESAAAPFG